MKKIRLSYLFVFSFLVLVNNSFAQEYDLKYKLQKGAKFTVTVSSATETIQEVQGNEMIINGTTNSETNFEVLLSDNNSGLTMELEYVKRLSESDSPMGASSTDFSELIGKKVKYILSSKGEASGFEGFENLPVIETPNGQTIEKDRYIASLKNLFPKLSDTPVKIGGTWTHSEEDSRPMEGGSITITTDFTCTLLEETTIENIECLKIERKTVQNIKGTFEQMGNEIALEQKGEGSDIIYFAHKTGMILSGEGTTTTEGFAEIVAMEMSIPMSSTIKNKVVVTLSK